MKIKTKFAGLLFTASLFFASESSKAQDSSIVNLVSCGSQAVTVNLNTGVNSSGTVLPAGSAEANWSCPSGMGTVFALNGTYSNLSGSAWLGVNNGASYSNFTYTRTFSLPASGTINFQALADNNVVIKLDGVQIAQTPGSTIWGFQIANVVNYSGAIAAGSHTLTAIVYNETGPAGFNFNGSASCTTTTAPASINISTGVSSAGAVLPVGSSELNWSCPAGMGSVVSPISSYGSFTGSAWVGNNNNVAVMTNYVYSRSFTISSSGSISFQALADNNVILTLDGVQIAQTPGGTIYGFQPANVVNYTGPIAAGSHTLTATVYNVSGPSGFNLSGNVSYCAGITPPPPCTVSASFAAAYAGYNTASFTGSVAGGTGISVTESWSFGDGTTSSLSNPTHVYSSSGTYIVRHSVTKSILGPSGQVLNYCTDATTCVLTISNASNVMARVVPGSGTVTLSCGLIDARQVHAASNEPVSLLPNPASNAIRILGGTSEFEDIQVFSMDGRQVIHVSGVTAENALIDISRLQPGNYVIRLQQGGKPIVLKFVKAG